MAAVGAKCTPFLRGSDVILWLRSPQVITIQQVVLSDFSIFNYLSLKVIIPGGPVIRLHILTADRFSPWSGN